MENQTQEEFLKDLEHKETDDVFGEEIVSTEEVTPVVDPKKEEEEHFNRRERRLKDKLQAERESSIVLAARLEALTEAQKFSRDTQQSSFEEKASRIYGTETPESKAATDLLIASLREAKEDAKREAIEAFRDEQRKDREAEKEQEGVLDSMVEDIEDEYRVTLNEQSQKSFFQLLEKLSPKDKNGEITQYADHHAVWEQLQSQKTPTNIRAKDLASRAMVKTGASPTGTVEADANERFLKENGFI